MDSVRRRWRYIALAAASLLFAAIAVFLFNPPFQRFALEQYINGASPLRGHISFSSMKIQKGEIRLFGVHFSNPRREAIFRAEQIHLSLPRGVFSPLGTVTVYRPHLMAAKDVRGWNLADLWKERTFLQRLLGQKPPIPPRIVLHDGQILFRDRTYAPPGTHEFAARLFGVSGRFEPYPYHELSLTGLLETSNPVSGVKPTPSPSPSRTAGGEIIEESARGRVNQGKIHTREALPKFAAQVEISGTVDTVDPRLRLRLYAPGIPVNQWGDYFLRMSDVVIEKGVADLDMDFSWFSRTRVSSFSELPKEYTGALIIRGVDGVLTRFRTRVFGVSGTARFGSHWAVLERLTGRSGGFSFDANGTLSGERRTLRLFAGARGRNLAANGYARIGYGARYLEIQGSQIMIGSGKILAGGRVEKINEDYELNLAAIGEDLPVESVAPFFPPRWRSSYGRVSIYAVANGTAQRPDVRAWIAVRNGNLAGYPLEGARGYVQSLLDKKGAVLYWNLLKHGGAQDFWSQGIAELWRGGAQRASLQGWIFPDQAIAFFSRLALIPTFPSGKPPVTGRMLVDLHAGGPQADPVLVGRLFLPGGTIMGQPVVRAQSKALLEKGRLSWLGYGFGQVSGKWGSTGMIPVKPTARRSLNSSGLASIELFQMPIRNPDHLQLAVESATGWVGAIPAAPSSPGEEESWSYLGALSGTGGTLARFPVSKWTISFFSRGDDLYFDPLSLDGPFGHLLASGYWSGTRGLDAEVWGRVRKVTQLTSLPRIAHALSKGGGASLFRRMPGLADLSAHFVGTVRGSVESPFLDGEAFFFGQRKEYPFLYADFKTRGKGITLRRGLAFFRQGSITAAGQLPLTAGTDALDVELKGVSFGDLRALFPESWTWRPFATGPSLDFPGKWGKGTVSGRFHARGAGAGQRIWGNLSFLEGRLMDQYISALDTRFSWARKVLTISRFSANLGKGWVHGRGAISLAGNSSFSLWSPEFYLSDVDLLQRRYGRVSGTGKLELSYQGSANHPDIQARFEARDFSLGANPFDSVSGEVHWHRGVLELFPVVLRRGEALYRVQGTADTARRTGRISLDLENGKLGALLKLARVAEGEDLDGIVTGRIEASGSFDSLDLAGRFKFRQGKWRGIPLDEGEFVGEYSKKRFTAEKLILVSGDSFLEAKGKWDATYGIQMEVEAKNLDPARLTFFPQRKQVTGKWDIRLSASGKEDNIALKGHFEGKQGALAGQPFDRIIGDLSYKDQLLEVEEISLHRAGHTGEVRGRIPLRWDGKKFIVLQPLDLHVLIRNGDLGILTLFLPQVKAASGEVQLDLGIRGDPTQPNLSGQATVHKGRILFKGMDQVVSDVEGDLRFASDQISIQKLTGKSGRGAVDVTGSVALRNYRPSLVSIKAMGRNVELDITDRFRGTASADLLLSGAWDQLDLSGRITLHQGRISIPLEEFSPEVISFSRPSKLEAPQAVRSSLNLVVLVGKGVSLHHRLFVLPITGNVTAQGSFHQPLLSGELSSKTGSFSGNTHLRALSGA
ncbi:MAG: translocation/assembly module TamB domain-containing protein [Armatimonadetes bacterium]|nr:translocation/assembly module TamB domain-containing protein [Armatimonadota bacterium]